MIYSQIETVNSTSDSPELTFDLAFAELRFLGGIVFVSEEHMFCSSIAVLSNKVSPDGASLVIADSNMAALVVPAAAGAQVRYTQNLHSSNVSGFIRWNVEGN